MNPFRSVAAPVKWFWRFALPCAFLAPGGACLLGAPHKGAPKTTAAQFEAAPAQPDDLQATAGKDLALTPDNERKADALADFVQGGIAEDNGDADGALDAYRKVLAVDPAAKIRSEDADDDTLMLLSAKVGIELAKNGDPAAGIDLLKDTIKVSPKDAMAWFFVSQIYEKFLKKYDAALKYAQQALELEPNNFNFYAANYYLEIDLGQSKQAAELLDRASKAQNDDPKYWLGVGELYVEATVKDNQPIAPDDLKKMNTVFQKAASVAGDNPEVIAKVADFDVLTKQVKDAIPLYKKALALRGDSSDPALMKARMMLAVSLVATGQRDDAIKVLEDAIKIDPLSYSAYESLGELYADKQDYAHALGAYQQILLLNPNEPRNYAPVAELMVQLKKFDQAVNVMDDAHRKFPELPRVTYQLARILTAAKKNEEAMAAFGEAEAAAQISDNEMLDGEFYYYYGSAAGQAGQIPKATELLKKAIDLDPTGKSLPGPGAAYNDLGYLWVDHDQNLDEGCKLIQRALEMEPDNAAYVDSLAWYYYKKGDLDKALTQSLKAAEATKPEDAEVYDHVAEIYQKMGKPSEALNYWQKAITLDPDNKEIAKKIEAAKVKMTALPPATPGK